MFRFPGGKKSGMPEEAPLQSSLVRSLFGKSKRQTEQIQALQSALQLERAAHRETQAKLEAAQRRSEDFSLEARKWKERWEAALAGKSGAENLEASKAAADAVVARPPVGNSSVTPNSNSLFEGGHLRTLTATENPGNVHSNHFDAYAGDNVQYHSSQPHRPSPPKTVTPNPVVLRSYVGDTAVFSSGYPTSPSYGGGVPPALRSPDFTRQHRTRPSL